MNRDSLDEAYIRYMRSNLKEPTLILMSHEDWASLANGVYLPSQILTFKYRGIDVKRSIDVEPGEFEFY